MKLFSYLYQRVIRWAEHRHAPYYLAGVSFAESSFFPVPPDVMLISMALAKPQKAWNYALVATIGSVIGGMVGYIIGAFFFHFIQPYIVQFGYAHMYNEVQHWFRVWGFWVIFLAGFSPIPYKLFTIGAGAMGMAFVPFVLASIVGRSTRFFLVSAAMFWGGERLHQLLHKYVDIMGWLLVLLCLIAYLVWRLHY